MQETFSQYFCTWCGIGVSFECFRAIKFSCTWQLVIQIQAKGFDTNDSVYGGAENEWYQLYFYVAITLVVGLLVS